MKNVISLLEHLKKVPAHKFNWNIGVPKNEGGCIVIQSSRCIKGLTLESITSCPIIATYSIGFSGEKETFIDVMSRVFETNTFEASAIIYPMVYLPWWSNGGNDYRLTYESPLSEVIENLERYIVWRKSNTNFDYTKFKWYTIDRY